MQTAPALRQLANVSMKLGLCGLMVGSADADTLMARNDILPNGQQASSAAVPMLGAHTLLGQENQNGVSPAITAAIATQSSGSSFVVFAAGFASNSNPPTDSKSNTWTLLGNPVLYTPYGDTFDVKAYLAFSGNGGAGHTVSIIKNGYAAGEITIPFVEIRNADMLQDSAQNYPTGAQLTSGNVTTTGPAVLLAFWWGDGPGLTHTAVPNNGFTVIESLLDLPPLSAVQCAVAYKQVTAAGTYNVTWTQNPNDDNGAPVWLLAFQSSDLIFASSFE
jgi:hypothetical protein